MLLICLIGVNINIVANAQTIRFVAPDNIRKANGSTAANAIAVHHYGFNTPEFNYLLIQQEGDILKKETVLEKKNLLLDYFGIRADSIRIDNNQFLGDIQNKVAIGSFPSFDAEMYLTDL